MARRVVERVRDRHLTEEEAAKYRKIRELIAEELPDLRARAEARLEELREARQVFAELERLTNTSALRGAGRLGETGGNRGNGAE